MDSGVGGLTIVQAIQQAMPHLTITYLADNVGFPYGTLSRNTLVQRVVALVENVVRQTPPIDAIIIACNTASTVVLPHLRQRFGIPIIGVVPPIKPAGEISITRTVGLLATPETVRRQYVDNLIRQFSADCRFVRIGTPQLAAMAEAKVRGIAVDMETLADILSPLITATPRVDTVIFGCTHYPLLAEEMLLLTDKSIHWLNPAPAIARRLKSVLESFHSSITSPTVISQNSNHRENLFLFTRESRHRDELLRFLQSLQFSRIEILPSPAVAPSERTHRAE